MADYTHEYSNFPDELITMKEYKDINDEIASVVAQIETAKANGDYATAVAIVSAHPELSDYNFSASDVNRIVEEIRNAQIYATNITNAFSYGDDNFAGDVGDIWIGDADFGTEA